jgi:glutaminase
VAQNGHLNLLKYLINEVGADVNQATHDGRTPLTVASANKHEKLVRFLLKKGADAQASDRLRSLIFGNP